MNNVMFFLFKMRHLFVLALWDFINIFMSIAVKIITQKIFVLYLKISSCVDNFNVCIFHGKDISIDGWKVEISISDRKVPNL